MATLRACVSENCDYVDICVSLGVAMEFLRSPRKLLPLWRAGKSFQKVEIIVLENGVVLDHIVSFLIDDSESHMISLLVYYIT